MMALAVPVYHSGVEPAPPEIMEVPDLPSDSGSSALWVGIGIGCLVLVIGLAYVLFPGSSGGGDPLVSGSLSLFLPEPERILDGPESPMTLHRISTDLSVIAQEANLDLSPIGAL